MRAAAAPRAAAAVRRNVHARVLPALPALQAVLPAKQGELECVKLAAPRREVCGA